MPDVPVALLITFGSFAMILVLARLKLPLWAAIFAGAVTLAGAYFMRSGPRANPAAVLAGGLIEGKTVGMAVTVGLLLMLSELMRQAGQLERIVQLGRECLRRPALAMAAMPMVIGLIPMPGGAIFSASMVEDAAGADRPSQAKLSAVNYWFRHVWEYWWPLYPAVLLATTQSGIEPAVFALFMFPLTVAMGVSGIWIFRRTHPSLHVRGPRPAPGVKRQLAVVTSSIWIIILVYALSRGAGWAAVQTAEQVPAVASVLALVGLQAGHAPPAALKVTLEFLPICLGLVVSIAWTVRMARMGAGHLRKVALSPNVYGMVILAVAVMTFQHTLLAVGAPEDITGELNALGVPVLLVIALLPAIAGLVTGLGAGFVGTSFPLVIPLAQTLADSPREMIPYVMLAFGAGHMGMMLSPIHLCNVVTTKYFKTTFADTYREFLPPAAATSVVIAVYFVVLKLLVG